MSFEIQRLEISEDSPEGRVIDEIVRREHVSAEEAVRLVLRRAAAHTVDSGREKPGEGLIGLMADPADVVLMDEVVDMAMEARQHRWERLFGA